MAALRPYWTISNGVSGIRFRMIEHARIRRHIRFFIAGEAIHDLAAPLPADGELCIVRALSGGEAGSGRSDSTSPGGCAGSRPWRNQASGICHRLCSKRLWKEAKCPTNRSPAASAADAGACAGYGENSRAGGGSPTVCRTRRRKGSPPAYRRIARKTLEQLRGAPPAGNRRAQFSSKRGCRAVQSRTTRRAAYLPTSPGGRREIAEQCRQRRHQHMPPEEHASPLVADVIAPVGVLRAIVNTREMRWLDAARPIRKPPTLCAATWIGWPGKCVETYRSAVSKSSRPSRSTRLEKPRGLAARTRRCRGNRRSAHRSRAHAERRSGRNSGSARRSRVDDHHWPRRTGLRMAPDKAFRCVGVLGGEGDRQGGGEAWLMAFQIVVRCPQVIGGAIQRQTKLRHGKHADRECWGVAVLRGGKSAFCRRWLIAYCRSAVWR